ncbi:MAG: M1 family metallopeptidase [Firmicutes bacterium]|nr:M1 family metallopeptidase [Bacillota bacterium]
MIKKIILLFIITVLPLTIYIYMDKEVKETLKFNIIGNNDRYIIEGEFIEKEQSIDFIQIIQYTNSSNHELKKIYAKNKSEHAEVSSIQINDEVSNFKIIGKDRNTILIVPKKEIAKGETITLNIEYKLHLKQYNSNNNEKNKEYILENWYLTMAELNQSGWQLESDYTNSNIDKLGNYSIKIILPVNYKIDTQEGINNLSKTAKNNTIYYLQASNINKILLKIVEKNHNESK